MSNFNREDRPFGEKVERRGQEFKEGAKERGQEIKEDFKGAARRIEGEAKDDPGLKREHEPSMLEKAGESLKNAGEYIRDSVYEGAQKVGLVKEGENK